MSSNATTKPTRPYQTESHAFGTLGETRPCKIFAMGPGGVSPTHGDFLTNDEAAVEKYVQHLESEQVRLQQRITDLENEVEKLEPAYLREQASRGAEEPAGEPMTLAAAPQGGGGSGPKPKHGKR